MDLVGVHHADLLGRQRLRKLLDEYSPESISIEIMNGLSTEKVESIILNTNQKNKYYILRQCAFQNVSMSYTNLLLDVFDIIGYEFLESINYARENNAQIYFVDQPEFYDKNNISYPVAVIVQNIISIVGLDNLNSKEKSYEELEKIYIKGIDRQYCSVRNNILSGNREDFMAEELRRLKPDLHIAGINHVYNNNPDALCNQLKDITENKIRLSSLLV